MRAAALAALLVTIAPSSTQAVITVSGHVQCSDRNALQGVAIDARLIAIELYYKGLIQGISDKKMQACLEAHVLMDDSFVIINRARDLIERNCLPIDVAARMAAQDACP